MATVGYMVMGLGVIIIFITLPGLIFSLFFRAGKYLTGLMAIGALMFVAGVFICAIA